MPATLLSSTRCGGVEEPLTTRPFHLLCEPTRPTLPLWLLLTGGATQKRYAKHGERDKVLFAAASDEFGGPYESFHPPRRLLDCASLQSRLSGCARVMDPTTGRPLRAFQHASRPNQPDAGAYARAPLCASPSVCFQQDPEGDRRGCRRSHMGRGLEVSSP